MSKKKVRKNQQSNYQVNVKQMVREVAVRLENKLMEMKKPELVPHICEELISILKQHNIKWNASYIRKCLEEKYKNPLYRTIAMTRHERAKKENIGVAMDSGRTIEELEEALERERQIGEYVVKTNLKFEKGFKSRKELRTFLGEGLRGIFTFPENKDDKGRTTHIGFTMTLPAIVKANVKERDATIELDMDAYNQLVKSKSSLQKQSNKILNSLVREFLPQILDS